MRERLHAYTKRTLGAGGSYNDAVRLFLKTSFNVRRVILALIFWKYSHWRHFFFVFVFPLPLGGTASR